MFCDSVAGTSTPPALSILAQYVTQLFLSLSCGPTSMSSMAYCASCAFRAFGRGTLTTMVPGEFGLLRTPGMEASPGRDRASVCKIVSPWVTEMEACLCSSSK